MLALLLILFVLGVIAVLGMITASLAVAQHEEEQDDDQ